MQTRSTTTHRMATGFIAPYIRVATHIGYALHMVSSTSDDDWTDTHADLRADFREALGHLQEGYADSAFLNPSAIDALRAIRDDIVECIDTEGTREEMQTALQTLATNIAWAGMLLERAVTGAEVTEGTEI